MPRHAPHKTASRTTPPACPTSAKSRHATTPTTATRAILAQQSGVSLAWVLIVVLVLLIVAGTALMAVNARFGGTANERREQQAHYTAVSTLEAVSRWIALGTQESADADHRQAVERLLKSVEENTRSGGMDYPLQGLSDTLGECTLHLEYTDEKNTSLKLTATATFADVTETLSLTMHRGRSTVNADELVVSNYDGNKYDARATELSNLQSGGIVALYEANNANNTNSNGRDLELVNGYITNVSTNVEARWTNVNLTASTGSHNDNILGTQRYPVIDKDDKATNDIRRFMVPANGRITIDPLEGDADANTGSGNAGASGANNTKLVALSIDNTVGKSVLFRLASGNSATSSTLLNGTSGVFSNRSQARWASLLMFNFTDNAADNTGTTPPLNYTIDGKPKTYPYPWHPNKWTKLDIFVQPNSDVTSNLIIGPFEHKYEKALDRISYGNFVDNWHGTTSNEFKSQWPYIVATARNNARGLPIFPVDYGENASFWILDKRPDRYFRIMQGASIIGKAGTVSSTIYSTRPTIIGGALIRSSTGRTTDSLNREEMDGYANLDPLGYAMYVEATTRYELLIYNTDIILKAPSSGTAASVIRRPDTWRDRINLPSTADKLAREKETSYESAVTIKGGTIYVGANQSLTIQGTVRGAISGGDPRLKDLDNMWISPDRIVVAQGGELILEPSETFNVLTDIYVDGGTLTIYRGARIKGNIYAYNGA
ncbi:MAG: hypothetical protein LBK67_10605, partial [Coriobacteriales bacterium]|nr:hypothetical protein [Coriobacteriales bacterium]